MNGNKPDAESNENGQAPASSASTNGSSASTENGYIEPIEAALEAKSAPKRPSSPYPTVCIGRIKISSSQNYILKIKLNPEVTFFITSMVYTFVHMHQQCEVLLEVVSSNCSCKIFVKLHC